MTWYTWQNPVSGGQFQMHSHLVSPGHVFCVHHGPVAYQKLFSKGLKFSATAGISLLKIFNSLHLILPLGLAINIPLLLFPQPSPPPPRDLQDHMSPNLKVVTWLLSRALLGMKCAVCRTQRGLPKIVFLWERGCKMQWFVFSILVDYVSMPLTTRTLNLQRVYFSSSGLHTAYQDLQG